MPTACRLNSYSLRHKFFLYYLFLSVISLSSMFNSCPLSFIEMEAARMKASVRASTAACKKEEKGKEEASSSASKFV